MANVAIIGAGLTGIGCLRELVDAGHNVTLYESNNDVGGVWHPSNAYSGFAIHAPAVTFEYHDFPLPRLVDKSKRIPSAQVYDYLRSYLAHKNLYRYCEFESSVEKIGYSRDKKKLTLHILNSRDRSKNASDFDYAVNTHGFAARTLPDIPNLRQYRGTVLHSFDATEARINEIVRLNRKVVILGGSKTATDLVLGFHVRGYNITWVYRKNYWFIRSDPLMKVLEDRMAGRRASSFYPFVFVLGDLLGSKAPKLHFALWRLSGLLHTFGVKHGDFTKYHRGRIDDASMGILKQYSERHGVIGDIETFTASGIRLKDGQSIDCDVVIFCTGSSSHKSLAPVEIDHEPLDLQSVRKLYRARVIPQVPGLIFTGFHLFSFGVVSGLMAGKWIAKYIEAQFDEAYLSREATTHEPPLLSSSCYLFSSSEHFNVNAGAMLTPFFESGEVSKYEYARWLWQSSFAVRGVPPLSFQIPRNWRAMSKSMSRSYSGGTDRSIAIQTPRGKV